MILDKIRQTIALAVGKSGISVEAEEIKIEHPTDFTLGDYSTNIALILAKRTDKKPQDLAKEIVSFIQTDEDLARVEVAGPGFINFYLTDKFFVGQVAKVLAEKDCFGSGSPKGKKVLVEYSSPNIAKPFSIGHLRSTIIGDAVANILKFCGYEVIRDNHLGDWGTQFGKQIVAIKKWGDVEAISKSENPVKELVALYVKFHEEAEKDPSLEDEARAEFLKLEQGDLDAKKLWQSCIDWSMVQFDKIYGELGVKFDTVLGESTFVARAEEVYKALMENNLMKESEGADLVFFADEKIPPMIVRKKDGSSIYATRDLGADLERKEKYGEGLTIINEVGGEQEMYLRQLFETEKMLGWYKDGERIHVSHGLYRFSDGKMSTRKGNVIWLEDVLAETIKRAEAFNADKEVASLVGIGALKYNDLKRDSKANILFDWEEVMNLKGNSGPYLQYAHARTQSILAKAEKEGVFAAPRSFSEVGETISAVEKLLYRFPEVVARACQDYAPHHLATYLYDLASTFSGYYVDHQVVSQEANSPYRVALTEAVGIVLKNGLKLLGIEAPKKM